MAKHKNVPTEYRNYYLPLSFPVLLLSGDHWRISDVTSMRLHFHNCLEIGVCHSDSGAMEFYGEPLPFREGDVTVVPRNVPHTTYSAKGTASLWSYLFIDPKALFRDFLPGTWKNWDLLAHNSSTYKFILNREEYPGVYETLMLAIKELENQKPGYQLSATGLLLSLYLSIYRIENADSNRDLAGGQAGSAYGTLNSLSIAPALDYVENNYMKQFSIEFLAGLCHWSPTHFRRVFHDVMGTSPLDYVNNTRVMKSCDLLCNTQESILNISGMVGFQSVSSYNRCFIKIMGTSPREYRKQTTQTNQYAKNQSILQYSGWMYPE